MPEYAKVTITIEQGAQIRTAVIPKASGVDLRFTPVINRSMDKEPVSFFEAYPQQLMSLAVVAELPPDGTGAFTITTINEGVPNG